MRARVMYYPPRNSCTRVPGFIRVTPELHPSAGNNLFVLTFPE